MSTFKTFGPYEDALKSLGEIESNDKGITYEQAINKLEITPGLWFTPGNTWDGIINRMKSWGWLYIDNGGLIFLMGKIENNKFEQVISLEYINAIKEFNDIITYVRAQTNYNIRKSQIYD